MERAAISWQLSFALTAYCAQCSRNLLCPNCGSTMKIKSFIHNPHEIERLCTSLGLVSW